MSATKRETVNAANLLKGQGALTHSEMTALATEYRTAQTTIDGQTFRKARVCYVVNQRGAMDADGATVSQKDLAKMLDLSEAAVSQYASGLATLIAAGFDVASTRPGGWAKMWNAAVAIRKVTPGKDKDAQAAMVTAKAEVLADIAAMPEEERAGALVAAHAALKDKAAELRKGAASTGEAQSTPETNGEAALRGKADVIASIAEIAAEVADNGYALRNAEASQVARYLAEIARNLGVDLAEVAALV